MRPNKPDPYGVDAPIPAGEQASETPKPTGGAVRPHDKEADPYGLTGAKPAASGAETDGEAPAPAAPAAASSGRFTTDLIGGVHVVSITQANIIDGREIEQLGDDIYHFVKTIDEPKIVLDMQNVKHLSSAALGMLIALNKVVGQRDGGICIANVTADIQKIFKLTKLNKVLKIYGDTDKAIKSLL